VFGAAIFYEHNMTINWCCEFAVNLAIFEKVCRDVFFYFLTAIFVAYVPKYPQSNIWRLHHRSHRPVAQLVKIFLRRK